MTSDLTGRVVAVNTVPLGDVLAADAPVGSLSLFVEDAADFAPDGGYLRLGGSEGVVLDYTSADDETGEIVLGAALAVDGFEGDSVEVWDFDHSTPVVETLAEVAVEGSEQNDDTLEAAVEHALIPYLPEGIRADDGFGNPTGESVDLVYRGDDLFVVNITGKPPVFDGTMIDPATLPSVEVEPPAAPTAGPTLEVYANPKGFVVIADGIAEGATISYHIGMTAGFTPDATTLIAETRTTVVNVETLPDGTPLNPAATYYLKATQENVSGSAGPGDEISSSLRLVDDSQIATIAASKVVAGDLIGAYALLGALNVGSAISLSSDQGIVISLEDGGIINFPSDGSPANITAELVALALTVKGALRILGTDNEIGQGSEVYLSEGVRDPGVAPTATYTWPRTLMSPDLSNEISQVLGVEEPGRVVMCAYSWTGANDGKVWLRYMDPATGAMTEGPTLTGLDGNTIWVRGMVKGADGNFYVLYSVNAASGGHWNVRAINPTTGAMVREWQGATSSMVGSTNNYGAPGIATRNNGNEIVVGYVNSSYAVVLRRFTLTGTLSYSTTVTGYTASGGSIARRLIIGSADGVLFFNPQADDRTTWKGRFNAIADYSDTATSWGLDAQNNFPVASDPEYSTMMLPNSVSEHFHEYDGHLWRYGGKYVVGGGVANATLSDEFVYTWRDSDPGGTGEHETLASPPKTLTGYPMRATPIVTTPPIGETTNADSVNSVRVYSRKVGDAAYMWDRWDPAPGVISVKADQMTKAASIQSLPTLNTFATANLTPGSLRSGKIDGRGNVVRLEGDGAGRVGGYEWDADGVGLVSPGIPGEVKMWAAPGAIPTGWLQANGAAVSRTTYARLFAVIGTTWGAGDGSTTFNLPNLTNRVPRGSTVGSYGGADTVTMPDHTHPISGQDGGSAFAAAGGGTNVARFGAYDGHAHGGATGTVSGTNPPISNVPSYAGLVFIIKT